MEVKHVPSAGGRQRASLSSNAEVLCNVRLVSRFERMSRAFSIVVMLLAGVVLLGGYLLGIPDIRSLVPGLPKMMPNTALGLLLSAVSLFIHNSASRRSGAKPAVWTERFLSAAVVCLGIATIAEYLLGINPGIDQLIFRDLSVGATYPGRPSPQTSLAFVITGVSLLLLGGRRLWVLLAGQLLGVVVGFIAIVAMVGYVYASLPFYGITTYTGMAIHTAFSFLAISVGIIFAQPDRGLAAVFTSDSHGGHVARRLLPAIIIVPIVLGILTGSGERIGLFSTEFGRALDVTLHIVLLGAELWLFAMFLDRSDVARREATRAMNLSLEQLKTANQELGDFSSLVSTNLSAPLRNMTGYSDDLLKDYGERLDEQGKQCLRRIRESGETMVQLINDLLRLAQVAGAEMHTEQVDLSKLAETVIDDLRKEHPERRVEWVVAPGLICEGDSPLLRMVLENMLGNAWKFSGKVSSARIEMNVIEVDGERALFVRDNGAGFDMAYADKLFRPFQSLHQASDFPGTGIGLAIVRRIIHRHGGRVWAEGKKDEGATFYFTLPSHNI